jgi:hypothetical protein
MLRANILISTAHIVIIPGADSILWLTKFSAGSWSSQFGC